MSNNIYDILKKMQSLEAPKQSLTESKKAKPDYIDIDKDGNKKEPMKKAAQEKSKGAVAEAVATVEAQLNEKYMGFKKTVAAIKKGGSAENPEAVAAEIGRKKYGPEKMKKAAAAGKKLGEETQQWQSVKQGAKDVADVVQGLATMATGGKVRSIDQRMADAARAEQAAVNRAAAEKGYELGTKYHNQLIKTNPAYREEYMSLAKDAPMGQLRNIQNRLQLKHDPMGGPMDESALQAHIGMKKYGPEGMEALQQAGREGASKEKMARIRAQHDKMDEDGTVPPKHYGGTGPTGAAFDLYMAQRKEALAAQKPKNEDMLSAKEKSFAALAEPKNKITYADKIAGAKKGVKKEGPEILKIKSDQAKAQGKDEFKVGDKTFPVKEDDFDAKGNRQLSPAEADKVYKHPNYNPNLSANAQYDTHFDEKGHQRVSHDQAVQISKHPNYNPNLSANAQGNLLNKNEGRASMPEGEAYDAAWAKTQSERKAWEKSNPGEKYYGSSKSPVERHDMELEKARAADRATKDAGRSPLGRVANTLSRGLFGQELPEGRTSMREGWEEMQKYLEKKRGPESKGGAGKKAGTRYGGSAQKDDDEATDGEGQAVVKKKGRPKGTGGGAKFNFKKPKD